MKDNFIFHIDEFMPIFEKLDGEHRLELLKAMCEYTRTGDVPSGDAITELAFAGVQGQMVSDKQSWIETCKRNQRNGEKGGRPPKPKKPSGLLQNPKNPVGAKKPDSDCDSDSDKGQEQQPRAYASFYIANIGILTPTVLAEAESFITDDGMEDILVEFALKKAVDNGAAKWTYAKKILHNWLERGILTLEQAKAADVEFERQKQRSDSKKRDFTQRDYSPEEFIQRDKEAVIELERLYGGGG